MVSKEIYCLIDRFSCFESAKLYCLISLFIFLGEDAIDSKVNNDEETLTVTLNKPLEAGTKAVFSCKFSGELNDKMRGFYRYVN